MADNNKPTQNRPPNTPQEPNGQGPNVFGRIWFWIALVALVVIGSRFLFSTPGLTGDPVGLSEIAQEVKDNNVKQITVQGETIILEKKDSGAKITTNQVNQADEGLPLGIIGPLSKVSDGEALYITGGDGFKAILVVASRSQPVAFDQAKPAIEQYLTAERRREFALKEMKGLRDAAKVEYLGKFANKPNSSASASASAASTTPTASSTQQSATSEVNAEALQKGLSGLK